VSTPANGKTVPGGKNVLVEFEDGIAWVSLNRPEKRNAMSVALAYEMLGPPLAPEGAAADDAAAATRANTPGSNESEGLSA